MKIAEELIEQSGIKAEEAMLFREWWHRLCQGYPDIPAMVLAASLGRVFCEKMRIERNDKPDAPGETIFFFAEPEWQSLDNIVDWLQLSVREDAAWLRDADADGRPNGCSRPPSLSILNARLIAIKTPNVQSLRDQSGNPMKQRSRPFTTDIISCAC